MFRSYLWWVSTGSCNAFIKTFSISMCVWNPMHFYRNHIQLLCLGSLSWLVSTAWWNGLVMSGNKPLPLRPKFKMSLGHSELSYITHSQRSVSISSQILINSHDDFIMCTLYYLLLTNSHDYHSKNKKLNLLCKFVKLLFNIQSNLRCVYP